MKNSSPSVILAFFSLITAGCGDERYNFKPENGVIPNSETAIAVAVSIWNPIYGIEKIAKESPYSAKLVKGVWFVSGSIPDGVLGGVAEIEIDQKDGKIIYLSHGK